MKWYRKAEEEPYLFKESTIFGAGEHKDEMLYGRARLMDDIESAVDGGARQTTIYFGDVNISGIANMEDATREFIDTVKSEMEIA